MPRYTYQCQNPACACRVELPSSIAERDVLKEAPHKGPDDARCEELLKRVEELEMTGFTPYAWRP